MRAAVFRLRKSGQTKNSCYRRHGLTGGYVLQRKLRCRGRPGAETSQLLDRSYLVAPLDPQIFTSRTRFVLEHWNVVTRPVREEALAQIRVGWQNWI